ncbi:16S rRNA (cytidine(1402)-2'-O)-methyltransferase [Campylobacter sp. MIT 12-8780]|uniref:16S rRNA (cytidine(1402)-2'-O)-methyltransferase n=1 Tax=unclassified Campylobacter TaxID=2593542 RepID=UPI00115D0FD7|nr:MULTISPECIES: 16S rRNA (cytidine(1402)-2'-O)-methyltransferase [unclassified Campylobacter]NDJ27040.1 16S rRNA (cytidine(1402)-2'-O)-methyltransferase [Campylobacter sp. MIT 19-121]TQR41659.1 16S rRNA (cytidine(1402)-2'-O)-methyltransferase [Campylobacter sp. MIT 12-8780]
MLYLIPTPIGNLADISYRAIELLKTCKIVLCEDTRVCKSLLHLLSQKFELCFENKEFISFHSHNEKEVLASLNADFFKQDIIFMSDAGMPCVSDPGSVLVDFALKNNIAYEVLPGANAAITAFAASGFGVKEFIFMGFLSNKGKQRQNELENLLLNPFVSIVYEAPTRVLALLESLALLDPQRIIFIIKEISKKFEKKFKASAQELLNILQNENLNGEWVLVIDANKETNFARSTLNESDILALDISLKEKSKLLAKITQKNAKELYNKLLLSQNKVE